MDFSPTDTGSIPVDPVERPVGAAGCGENICDIHATLSDMFDVRRGSTALRMSVPHGGIIIAAHPAARGLTEQNGQPLSDKMEPIADLATCRAVAS